MVKILLHSATGGQKLHRGTFNYQAVNIQTVVSQWLSNELGVSTKVAEQGQLSMLHSQGPRLLNSINEAYFLPIVKPKALVLLQLHNI